MTPYGTPRRRAYLTHMPGRAGHMCEDRPAGGLHGRSRPRHGQDPDGPPSADSIPHPPELGMPPLSIKRRCDRRTTSTGEGALVNVHAKRRLTLSLRRHAAALIRAAGSPAARQTADAKTKTTPWRAQHRREPDHERDDAHHHRQPDRPARAPVHPGRDGGRAIPHRVNAAVQGQQDGGVEGRGQPVPHLPGLAGDGREHRRVPGQGHAGHRPGVSGSGRTRPRTAASAPCTSWRPTRSGRR